MSTNQVEQVSYPMRLVTKLTGLTSDTIRAWERRYHAIDPARTDGNTRQFSPQDVKRLNLLREATRLGHAISSIASLPTEDLEKLVSGRTPESDLSVVAESYLESIERFEARGAMDLLRRSAATLDPKTFVLDVVLPIIRSVGERWSHRELGVAQEHLVSSHLMTLLHSLPVSAGRNAKRVVCTTPPGDRHGFGCLIGAMLSSMRGFEVIHLGADLPYEDLAWATKTSRADVLMLSVVTDMDERALEEFKQNIERLARWMEIWICASPDHAVWKAGLPVRYFSDYREFDEMLVVA